VERIAELEAVHPCQILQLLSCFWQREFFFGLE
jgi:hypothetical protein